jgi:hypothetical protein
MRKGPDPLWSRSMRMSIKPEGGTYDNSVREA